MIRPDDKDKIKGKSGSGAPSTQLIASEASDGVDAGSGAPVTQPSREFAEAISRRTDRNMSPPRDTPESQQEVVAAARTAGSRSGELTKEPAHSSIVNAPTVQPSQDFAEAIRKRTTPVNFSQEELEPEEREAGDNASVMPKRGQHAPDALEPEEEKLRQQEAQELADAVKGTDENINLVQKWLDEHPRLTKEQRERLDRREKSRRLMASVGDGLSALGSLFFTTQYSPELFDARHGQSAQVDARQEKLRAQREREADRYMNFALRLGDLKNGRAGIAREVAAMQQKRRRENEEDKRRREREPYVLAAAQEEANRKKALAHRAQVQADKEPALIKSVIDRNKSQADKNRRWQPSAGRSGGSGRSSKPGPTLFVHDKAHYPGGSYLEFGNTTEYNKAVMAWASYYDVPTTTTSPRGTTVSRGIPVIAAEVEAKAREAAEGQEGSHPRQSPRVIAGGPGRGVAINGARQAGASGSNGKKNTLGL